MHVVRTVGLQKKPLNCPPVQSPRNRPEHDLHDPRSVQPGSALSVPGHRVHHVPHAPSQLRQPVIQLPQRFRRAGLVADLEELDADLPRRGFQAVQGFRRVDDDGFRVVAGHPVGDDDDVERLELFLAGQRGFQCGEVRFQDGAQSGSGRGVPVRPHGVEDAIDVRGLLDVVIIRAVALVEEIDVHPVRIVRGADGRDGFQGVRRFPPAAPGHAAAVVNQKDGVERAQEGVRIVGGRGRDGC